MKLTVLGCSNTWTTRFTSCYLINDNILMDCGADAYKAYIQTGKSLNDIKLFLITHFHADHIFGLNVFLTNIHRRFESIGFKATIVGPKGIKEACENVFKYSTQIEFDFKDRINFIEIQDGQTIILDNIKITGYKLDHDDVVDFGYILNDGGKTLGYTGDTTDCDEFRSFLSKSDVCIMNISRPKTNSKHLGVDTFEQLLSANNGKTLLATHCDEEVYNLPIIKENRVEEGQVYNI